MTEPKTPDVSPGRDQLTEEASLWFARMRGPDADVHRPSFEAWLARGAAHLGAYNRAAEIFNMGKFLAEADDEDGPATVVPVRGRWRSAVLAGGAALILLLGIWIGGRAPGRLSFENRHEIASTHYGTTENTPWLAKTGSERRSFQLGDGSTALLEPRTRLIVAFERGERSLRLTSGRGRFTVAHEQRPFVVYAGGGHVTARGTIFDVSIDARKRVLVKLLRGAIDVALSADSHQVRRITLGEEFQFAGSGTAFDTPAASETDSRPAITADPDVGEFDNVTLASLLTEANRHGGARLHLADPALGALRMSGRFSLADPAKLAERVAILQDLAINRRTPNDLTLSRR